MTDVGAATANPALGSARKRTRKRSRKSKSSANTGTEGAGKAVELGHKNVEDSDIDESDHDKEQKSSVAGPSRSNAGSSTAVSQSRSHPSASSSSSTITAKSVNKGKEPSTPFDAKSKTSESSTRTAKNGALAQVNPHKPSFLTRPVVIGGRKFTVSVAIPGSIVLNAQSPELQSRLAAHIARACAIFNVDEVVVFDEGEVRTESDPYQHRYNQQSRGTKRRWNQPQGNLHNEAAEQSHGRSGAGRDGEEEYGDEGDDSGKGGGFDPHAFLARVLQYLETPQYLRKALFPMHRDLRLAGLMPPLDCPHHLRFEDESEYREGVTVDPPHWSASSHRRGKAGKGGEGNLSASTVFVNVGLSDPIEAELPAGASVETGTRVTVRMPSWGSGGHSDGRGRVVSPREPVEQKGLYWGYTVRLASSLSSVLTNCPFSASSTSSGGIYDLVMGTSERGVSLADLTLATLNSTTVRLPSGETVEPLPTFSNALIVFGGLSGLELAVEADKGIKLDRHSAKDLFDAWINVVENQGSRTVRTEEAIMIALARLKPLLEHFASSNTAGKV